MHWGFRLLLRDRAIHLQRFFDLVCSFHIVVTVKLNIYLYNLYIVLPRLVSNRNIQAYTHYFLPETTPHVFKANIDCINLCPRPIAFYSFGDIEIRFRIITGSVL